jgi:flavin reductase (DIM6/NTAB) family NADH-FMN oxidoreductase RutF/DNA-binding transcriptional LysR family regulator
MRERFLSGMSHAACTVNVVTTDGIAGRHGVTVSAMVSVSADLPEPVLLVCIHHRSPVAAALLGNGVFCVNVLREDQWLISDSFAGRTAAQGAARFECARWTTQVTGAPRVVDALVAFDCRVTASEQVGSHYVVFGAVLDVFEAGPGAPLIYANRAYGVPQHFLHRAPTRDAGTRTLALGCFQTFAPYLLPALIARMTKLDPDLQFSLLEADQDALLSTLRRCGIEVALLYDFGLDSTFAIEPLAELQPYILLPAGHPLAAQARISLSELAGEPLVLLDLAPSRDYFLSLFTAQGLHATIGFRAASFEMVRGLVGHGLGYSLLATKPANDMTYDGRALVSRPLATPSATSRLVLASVASRPLSAHAQEFARHCRAFFQR